MKRWKQILALVLAALAVMGSGEALAHRRVHGHVGVFIGAPVVPWYYPPPFYYYPPVVTVPAAPPVYIEQGSPAPSQSYWHYCRSREAYYPYVKDCPEAWEKVAPQP